VLEAIAIYRELVQDSITYQLHLAHALR
jgi:hypothetical protein